MSAMGDYVLEMETAIYDALREYKTMTPEAVEFVLNRVREDYPHVTETMVRDFYKDVMYD